jgi:DNA gyrase subunit A
MAQDFSMRYLLIEGQGNFGSVDGDAPAAMRYTEARLSRPAEEMLADIEMDTVELNDNFDGTLKEPAVLPARLPNLLLNGSSGIAVGMATNIPPHNLAELVTAISYLIDHYEQIEDVPAEELVKLVPGPDFPTGGVIVGSEGIHQAYSTGRGRLVLRGLAHIEDITGGRQRIVITEIPYLLNKSSLLERVAELVREGKLGDISDLRDESDRRGMSIIIELRRSAQPMKVLNQLYKYTPLQSTFGVQMLALVDSEPRLLSLKRLLQVYIDHRQEVIVRRSRFELEKARARAHILEGLLIALANLDDVIQTIRKSPDAEAAKEQLMSRFKLSELQAQAILDLQLRRLAALERQKIEDEHKQTLERIAYLEDLLGSLRKVLELIKTDLAELVKKYADPRRTRIAHEAREDFKEEDLVVDEAVLISITQRGYVKRVAAKSFRLQSRGGRGVTGHSTKEEDEVMYLFPARTLNTILFFSDKGKVYSEKAYQIPDADRAARGIPIVNILSMSSGETITAAVAVPDFVAAEYCTMATRNGKVKRVDLSEFSSVRPSGLIAITLEEGDELGWARLTDGEDEIILVTEQGQALRFAEATVRSMGRAAVGVNGIKLDKDDHVASMEVLEEGGELLVITTGGYGKRTALSDYPPKGRATGGVQTIDPKSLKTIGLISAARVVQAPDELTIISAGGVVLRTRVKDVKRGGRIAKCDLLISLEAGDYVASLARISTAELLRAGVEGGE